MFVEEGFRIRFANGEVIDFYADSAAEKGEWMKVLSEVVGKLGSSSQTKPWVEMILKRERSVIAKDAGRTPRPAQQPEPSPRKNSKDELQQQQQIPLRAPAARPRTAGGEEGMRPARAPVERSFGKRSSIPLLSSSGQSPEKGARYSQGPPRPSGHARTESHQPTSSFRSQPGSPVKGKLNKETSSRHQKAKSLIGMQWH